MMVNLIRKQSPARIIAFGFIFVIIAGSVLLSLPFSVMLCIHQRVQYV